MLQIKCSPTGYLCRSVKTVKNSRSLSSSTVNHRKSSLYFTRFFEKMFADQRHKAWVAFISRKQTTSELYPYFPCHGRCTPTSRHIHAKQGIRTINKQDGKSHMSRLSYMLMHLALALCELLDLGEDYSPGLAVGDSGLEGKAWWCSSVALFSSTAGNTFSA